MLQGESHVSRGPILLVGGNIIYAPLKKDSGGPPLTKNMDRKRLGIKQLSIQSKLNYPRFSCCFGIIYLHLLF